MSDFTIKKCTLNDIEQIKQISEETFFETFANENTEEDMKKYLKENFSYEQIEKEIKKDGAIFYMVKDEYKVVAYMKVNFVEAQTEKGYDNSLEVQRIYVLEKYKNKKIGKTLIEKAKQIAKENNLEYIWLGVWENNFAAIKFYEKQGFVKFDTHIFVLGDDEQVDNLMKYRL